MTVRCQRIRHPSTDQTSAKHEEAGHVPQMRSEPNEDKYLLRGTKIAPRGLSSRFTASLASQTRWVEMRWRTPTVYHMYKRPRPTRNMIILRTQAVGTPCPVVGCGVSLTPSGCTTTSCKVADSAATVEHILPLRLGGKHRLYNVTIICHAQSSTEFTSDPASVESFLLSSLLDHLVDGVHGGDPPNLLLGIP